MEYVSKNLDDTREIAAKVAANIEPNKEEATVIGLYGDLGSGKTTFMKFFAEHFGVEEDVQSPTFVIMKIYKILSSKLQAPSFSKLIHIDAYRLDSGQELLNLGFQEILSDPRNIVCIEWPERVSEVLPKHIVLNFSHAEGDEKRDPKERKISLA